jgi:hypothetical protein
MSSDELPSAALAALSRFSPVDVPALQAELSSAGGPGDFVSAFGLVDGNPYGAGPAFMPQLSAQAQAELVAVRRHTESVIDGSEPGRGGLAVRAAHEWAGHLLVGCVYRMIAGMAYADVQRLAPGPKDMRADIVEQVIADGCALALSAARTFDPAGGRTFSSWVGLQLTKKMDALVDSARGTDGGVPRSWVEVGRYFDVVRKRFVTENGREGTAEELGELLVRHQYERLWDKAGVDGPVSAETVQRQLVRSGVKAVSRQMPEFLAWYLGPADVPVEEALQTAADGAAVPEQVLQASLDGSVYEAALGGLDARAISAFNALFLPAAEGYDSHDPDLASMRPADVDRLLWHVRSRAAAPHVQFAYAPGSLIEVVDIDDEPLSAAATVRLQPRTRDGFDDAELIGLLGLI